MAKKTTFDLKAVVGIASLMFFATMALTISTIFFAAEIPALKPFFYAPSYDIPWLFPMNKPRASDLSDQEKYSPAAELKMMWQTPLMYVNIAASKRELNVPKLNAVVSAAILTEYQRLLAANKKKLARDGAETNDANQVFFEWQAKGGWRNLHAVEEIRILEDFFQMAVDRYLKAIGLDDDIIKSRSRQLDIWATVHEPGVSHLAHTHDKSLVSGVYYVKIPALAGSILFDDPRGPLPPFNGKLAIEPEVGDLVLFPSWLVHQVTPTAGKEDRISIAFNIPGEWATTVGISQWFPVE